MSTSGPKRRKSPHGEPWRFLHETAIPFQGTECLLWPYARAGKGYGKLRTPEGEKYAHRLICQAVHGDPPSELHECAHLCGRGFDACVNPAHLCWKTPKENAADKIAHGTDNKGERHGMAKLTETQVREIKRSSAPQAELAGRYNVSKSAIGRIRNRECWGWLD